MVVLRKEIALEMKKKVETVPTITEPSVPPEEVPPSAPPEVRVIKRVKLATRVPWDKLSDMMRGVLIPLNRVILIVWYLSSWCRKVLKQLELIDGEKLVLVYYYLA